MGKRAVREHCTRCDNRQFNDDGFPIRPNDYGKVPGESKTCPVCGGKGWRSGLFGGEKTCSRCYGEGKITTYVTCPDCGGKGYTVEMVRDY